MKKQQSDLDDKIIEITDPIKIELNKKDNNMAKSLASNFNKRKETIHIDFSNIDQSINPVYNKTRNRRIVPIL